jgi:uncharacterized membrane protein
MLFYVNLFFIYAISGYFFETLVMHLIHKSYNSSVLYGPWTMVYGLAVIVMIIVYLIIKKFKLSNIKEKILYFITITLVMTILEGISGYIIELTQNKIYWNYDNLKFNLGHYMALEISLIWGFFSLFSMYFIIPRIKEFVNKIPKIITYILIGLFLIDILISFYL